MPNLPHFVKNLPKIAKNTCKIFVRMYTMHLMITQIFCVTDFNNNADDCH
ncbi:hypothetical protein [Moraxella lacunata]